MRPNLWPNQIKLLSLMHLVCLCIIHCIRVLIVCKFDCSSQCIKLLWHYSMLLSWNHTWILRVSNTCDKLKYYHSDTTPLVNNKMTNTVVSWMSWVELFFNSWKGIALEVACYIDILQSHSWPEKWKCPCQKAIKKTPLLWWSMNPALLCTFTPYSGYSTTW